MVLLTTFILFAILIGIFVFYVKWTHSYWKRKGIPYEQPDFLIGNIRSQFRGKSLAEMISDYYDYAKSKGYKHLGRYIILSPTYCPIDLDIVKNIMQKDFSHFVNRGLYVNEEVDPLTGHLVNLEDDKWKNLRVKLTPTFTSGKMKMMFPTIVACSEDLEDVLRDHSVIQDPADIKDIVSRFTTDIIGSCAFGIDCNSLKNPNSEFRRYGKMIFDPPRAFKKLKNLLFFVAPKKFLKMFRLKQTEEDIESFFMNMVKNTVEYREKNNVFRKDFLHLLLQLKNKGEVTDEESVTKETIHNSNIGQTLSMNEIAAQCFVFYAAGFETSATTLTFALLELSLNQDVQEKLRDDVVNVLKKYNQQLTYETLMEMHYLDKVVNETLRKHPPFPGMTRICNKEYNIPGTEITLDVGTRISIPFQGIHRDPEYYPEAEKFDPERFSEENKAKRPPFSFLPFGEGPRICIGARFAMMEIKVGLITMIKKFRFTLNNKTQLPIRYVNQQFISSVKGGVWLDVMEIKHN